MATWAEIGTDSMRSAKELAGTEHYRSSISRAYYAAYCVLTSIFVEEEFTFARGWHNPSHDQVPDLIRNLGRFSIPARRELRRVIRILRNAREDADYRPGITIDRAQALNALRDAARVFRELGIDHD